MLGIMLAEMGSHDNDQGRISDRVREYFSAAGIDPGDGPMIPNWDGALLAWAAIRSGLVPPLNPIEPLSWMAWGHSSAQAAPGCVAVMTSGRPGQMRAGLVLREQGGKVSVVTVRDGVVGQEIIAQSEIIAARRPPGGTGLQPSAANLIVEREHDPQRAASPVATLNPEIEQRLSALEMRLAVLWAAAEETARNLETP